MAEGLLTALDELGAELPIVVRLDGTNEEEGRRILAERAPGNVVVEATMLSAAERAVALAPDRVDSLIQLAAVQLEQQDPAAAIGAQAQLMSDLLSRFGTVPLALAAYNAGPGTVRRADGIPDILPAPGDGKPFGGQTRRRKLV